MKKLKQIIPAFCAMLVSAVMLGTSTYAWFSVNQKVTVENMQVTAQANTQYFVVSNDTTFTGNYTTWTHGNSDKNNAALTTSGGIDASHTKVYPAAYGSAEDSVTHTTVSNKWYTANVNKYDGGTTALINVTELSAGSSTVFENNTNYFVGYTFYVGLAANSTPYATDETASTGKALKFKATNDAHGVEVAAVKIEQYDLTTSNVSGNSETLEIKGEQTEKTSVETYILADGKKCVKVTVYVYINGTHADVIDSKLAELTGSVSVVVGAAGETL